MHPSALPAGRLTYQGSAPPQSSSLNAAAAGATTRPTTVQKTKQRTRTSGAAVQPAANKVVTPQPFAEQQSLGSDWNHVVRGGRIVKATLPTPPEPAPRSVTEVPQKDKMTELNTGSNSANSVLKATKALRQAQVTSTNVKSGKSSPKNPNPTKPIPPPQSVRSPVEVSDLLDTLRLGACMELTRRLLTAAPTLQSGAERSRAFLKIIVLFVAEYCSTA
jgi:hypothetical protein